MLRAFWRADHHEHQRPHLTLGFSYRVCREPSEQITCAPPGDLTTFPPDFLFVHANHLQVSQPGVRGGDRIRGSKPQPGRPEPDIGNLQTLNRQDLAPFRAG